MEELNNTRIAQKQRNFSIILPLHISKKGLNKNKTARQQKHKSIIRGLHISKKAIQ